MIAKLGDRADADPDRGRRPFVRTSRGRSATRARSPRRWRRSMSALIRERMQLMPRKNRRNPEFFQAPEAPPARADAPLWAQVPGFDVRHVGGQKEYRCPGCDHIVRDGVWHLVVVPEGDADARRHWHTECWQRELKRLGRYRAPQREM